jgi:hypothetical protein
MLTTPSHLDLQILEMKHGKVSVVTCKKGIYTAKILDDNRNVVDSVVLETSGQFYNRTGKDCKIHLYADCPNFPEYLELTNKRGY